MKHTVTEHELPSGAKGLIVDVPSSDVVNVVIRFNSGFQFADQTKFEIPHVMEHLLATVTQKYPSSNAYMIEAQKQGAYVNAHTSSIYNDYVFECASFELDRMLNLLEEQLVRPLFAKAPLEAEIGNVSEELKKATTDHAQVGANLLAEASFPGQSMNFDKRIAQLGSITVEDMSDHYHRTHTAANARFYIVGHFGAKITPLTDRLELIFGQLPRSERAVPNDSPGLLITKPIVAKRDISQIYYTIDFYGFGVAPADRVVRNVFRLMMAGGFQSRILGELRNRGLAYAFNMSSSASSKNSEFELRSFVSPDNAVEAFKVMARHLMVAKTDGLEAGELEAAKLLGAGSIRRSIQTGSDLMNWYIGPYDSDELIIDIEDYLNQVNEVSLGDISRVVKQAFSSGLSAASFVGDVTQKQAIEYAEILNPIWK